MLLLGSGVSSGREGAQSIFSLIELYVFVTAVALVIYKCMHGIQYIQYNIVCVCVVERKNTHLRGCSLYYVYYYISPGQGDCRELKLKSTRGK